MTFLLDLLHKEPACRSAVQRVFGCEAAHSCATCGKCFDFRDAWQLYCQSSAVPASAKADTGLEASLVRHLHPALLPPCGGSPSHSSLWEYCRTLTPHHADDGEAEIWPMMLAHGSLS